MLQRYVLEGVLQPEEVDQLWVLAALLEHAEYEELWFLHEVRDGFDGAEDAVFVLVLVDAEVGLSGDEEAMWGREYPLCLTIDQMQKPR